MYNLGRRTALIVEDDMVCMFKVIVLLEKYGFKNFLKAADGEDAVSIYEQAYSNISLVVMDHMMPNMDGLEATKQIRKFEAKVDKRNVPIIALTGTKTEDSCYEAGMDYYLKKPVTNTGLENILSKIAKDNNFQLADAG